MKNEMMIVTPDIALAYLAMNGGNRPMSDSHVEHLALIMKRGEWVFNGDSIRITTGGRLVDGQHRLSAIIKCGIPQKVMVVTGLDDSVFLTIDCGKSRSASDSLAIEGYACTTALTSCARYAINMEGFGYMYARNINKATSFQVLSAIKKNPEMQESAKYGQSKKSRKFIGVSLLSFCHYWFLKHDYIAGTEFFNEFESGDYSYANSPVKALKEKLVDNAVSTAKMSKTDKGGYIFLAFNKYMADESVRVLRLKKDPKEQLNLNK
tara:strand:+ start:109 stop:903 length:795 start_codon:yes stop_codon:yes gene_type:complete